MEVAESECNGAGGGAGCEIKQTKIKEMLYAPPYRKHCTTVANFGIHPFWAS